MDAMAELKALLDETGQSHIYEQTNILEDVDHPIRRQVLLLFYLFFCLGYVLGGVSL